MERSIKPKAIMVELPHDKDIEEGVIGNLLMYPSAYAQVQERLSTNDFYESKYQELYNCIRSVAEMGEQISAMSIYAELRKKGIGEFSPYSLYDLQDKAGGSDLNYLVNILNSLRTKREAYIVLQEAANECVRLESDTSNILEKVRKDLDDIGSVGKEHISELSKSINEVVRIVEENQNPSTKHCGTLTGFDKIDRKGGLQPSDLIIIGAESSMGKTSFAMSVVRNAIAQGNKVAFYSMEMTKKQLTARLLAMESDFSSNDILYGSLLAHNVEEIKRSAVVLERQCGRNLFFDDRSTSNIDTIISSIRTMSIKHHIDGAILDYLQILNVNMRNSNKEAAMGEIARRLKNLAKELGIWIIALSQLSRDRDNPIPSMSRLRDSGQIAEAADVVLLIFRPEYYSPSMPFPEPFKEYDTKGTAMVTIAKGRNIGVGGFLCGFDARTTKFYPKEVDKIVGTSRPF